jgi:hypothetical protein
MSASDERGRNQENWPRPEGLQRKSGHTSFSSSALEPPKPLGSACSGPIFTRNAIRPVALTALISQTMNNDKGVINMTAKQTMTYGVIVGNRGFFPGHLAESGREEILATLKAAGARTIVLSPEESRHGAVETYDESQRCAELFKKHSEEIDGIIITLPNFGEEEAVPRVVESC